MKGEQNILSRRFGQLGQQARRVIHESDATTCTDLVTHDPKTLSRRVDMNHHHREGHPSIITIDFQVGPRRAAPLPLGLVPHDDDDGRARGTQPGLEFAVMSARIDASVPIQTADRGKELRPGETVGMESCGLRACVRLCVCVCGVGEPGKPCSIQPSGNSPGLALCVSSFSFLCSSAVGFSC